jgi:peptidoglycan/LPS O-acetylase OafA/YrhL
MGACLAQFLYSPQVDFLYKKLHRLPLIFLAAEFLLYMADYTFFGYHIRLITSPVLTCLFLISVIRMKSTHFLFTSFKFLGKFSYSIYLTHPVALSILVLFFSADYLSWLIFGTIFCLITSFIFFLLVERHFLNKKERIHYLKSDPLMYKIKNILSLS